MKKNVVIMTKGRSGSNALLHVIYDKHRYFLCTPIRGSIFNIKNGYGWDFFTTWGTSYSKEYSQECMHILNNTKQPWCFSYDPDDAEDEEWINKKNTIVIVLVRHDVLGRLASKRRVDITGNRARSAMHRPISKELLEKNLLTENDIRDDLESRISFMERIEVLNPDVIVSYETLVKLKILDQSPMRKITMEPVESFYEDFSKAQTISKEYNTEIKEKNFHLLEEILT